MKIVCSWNQSCIPAVLQSTEDRALFRCHYNSILPAIQDLLLSIQSTCRSAAIEKSSRLYRRELNVLHLGPYWYKIHPGLGLLLPAVSENLVAD